LLDTEEQRELLAVDRATRLSQIDPRALNPPPRLIVNPHAGYKLGMPTHHATLEAVRAALESAGLRFDLQETKGPCPKWVKAWSIRTPSWASCPWAAS
jgi:hypothetical protein